MAFIILFLALIGLMSVGRFPGLEIKDVARTINAMRGVKTPAEIEQVRRSTDIASQAIAEAMKSTEPGMYEYQVAAWRAT